jgi:hypothetical protein
MFDVAMLLLRLPKQPNIKNIDKHAHTHTTHIPQEILFAFLYLRIVQQTASLFNIFGLNMLCGSLFFNQ